MEEHGTHMVDEGPETHQKMDEWMLTRRKRWYLPLLPLVMVALGALSFACTNRINSGLSCAGSGVERVFLVVGFMHWRIVCGCDD